MKRLALILVLFCSIKAYSQIDGDFSCNTPMILRCNKIPGPNFTEIDPSIVLADFRANNIRYWYDCYGTSDVNFNSLPGPFPGASYVDMGVGAYYEGITAKIAQVTAGRKYAFSFFIRTDAASYVQNVRLNVALTECQDFVGAPMGSTTVPALPNPHQKIYCEVLGTLAYSSWKQVFVEFTAEEDFNMIRIFPDQTAPHTNGGVGIVTIAYPELIDVTNFSAGSIEYQSECELTISGPGCSVSNAYYTWRDPNNNIVQQGPSPELELNLNNDPAGNYSVTMTVFGATVTNNTCSNNNPVITATVNVPGNCNCGSLEINNATFDYEWDNELPIAVNSCDTIRMCGMSLNGDDIFHFTGTSSQTNGNIWQIRKYNGPHYPNPVGIEVNGTAINYPASESFTTYSTSSNGNFTLFTGASNDCNFEIKLINTILNTSRIIKIKIVQSSGPSQNFFYCVSAGTGACPIPHKLIYAVDGPGYYYQWTLPAGMNPCSSLTNAWITWDDSNFNYNDPNHPPLVASCLVNNIFGCPPEVFNINIDPSLCVHWKNKTLSDQFVSHSNRVNSSVSEDRGSKLELYPNPASSNLSIKSRNRIAHAIIFNAQGVIINKFSGIELIRPLQISNLKPGTYFIKVLYENSTYEVKSIIKQ